VLLEQAAPQSVADDADGQAVLHQTLEDRAKACGALDQQCAIGSLQAIDGNQVAGRQGAARPTRSAVCEGNFEVEAPKPQILPHILVGASHGLAGKRSALQLTVPHHENAVHQHVFNAG